MSGKSDIYRKEEEGKRGGGRTVEGDVRRKSGCRREMRKGQKENVK